MGSAGQIRFDRAIPPRCSALGFKLDNEQGAYLAVHHLLEQGHRGIACITGPANNNDGAERLAGYSRALTDAGIAVDMNLVVEGDFHEAGGMMAMAGFRGGWDSHVGLA